MFDSNISHLWSYSKYFLFLTLKMLLYLFLQFLVQDFLITYSVDLGLG